jgi:hypothetical protein
MAWWQGCVALGVRRAWLLSVCGRRCRIRPLKGRGGASPGSDVEEVWWAPPADVLIGLNLVLQGWWLSRRINASWLGISQHQWVDQLRVLLFSDNGEGLCLVVMAMVGCSSTQSVIFSLCYVTCMCTNYISWCLSIQVMYACGGWYVSNVSIIFDAPCLFLHHLLCVLLHFVVFLCIFWN